MMTSKSEMPSCTDRAHNFWDTQYRSAVTGIGWPAIPAPVAASKLAQLFQLEQSQWWTPGQLQDMQFRQLQQVVRFARETVPFYRQHLKEFPGTHKIDPESWRNLPILSRQALHQASQQLKSERIPKEHGRQIPVRTSGSTGMVVEVLATDLTQFFWQVFCLRDHHWHRRDMQGKLLVIRYIKDQTGKSADGLHNQGWGSATDDAMLTGPAALYSILLDVPYLAGRLMEEKPAYLLSHPSVLLGLAQYCLDHGIRPRGLQEVRSLGESLPESLRGLCHQAWGVPLVDVYSCQEAGYLALQCPEHEHYHVQSENVLLEVIDDAGRPCKPGEIGRVVITSLNNFATPLIRYELGDYAEVGEPCPCGRGLPVLKRIMGRYRNLLTLPNGEQRWPRLGYESKLQEVAPIELMQMIQHSVDEIEVRLVMPRPLTEAEKTHLSAFIHKNLEHPFQLRFEYVDTIRNSANGKLEQFISKL